MTTVTWADRREIRAARERHPTSRRVVPAPGRVAVPGRFIVLLMLVGVLNLVGLIMVLSASSVVALHADGSSWGYFERQAVWTGLGALALLVGLLVDYRFWRRVTPMVLMLSFVLLVVVLLPGAGTTVNGSRSWLGRGSFRMQPAELMKLALLLYAADLLARRASRMHDLRATLAPVLSVFIAAAVLLMLQPDLGTAIVTAAIVVGVLFVAGAPLLPLLGWTTALGFGAAVLTMSAGYRRARLLAFLHPSSDPLNSGWQTMQSLVGMASGGLSGLGLGAGRAKWGYLPEAHTDFIFAIIGEELGFVGCLLVVGLFVGFGVLGARAAAGAPDRYGTLVAGGITAWILVQAFVNIGAVIGILPITGLPLPFVSFGGSSLIVTMGATGILLNIARVGR